MNEGLILAREVHEVGSGLSSFFYGFDLFVNLIQVFIFRTIRFTFFLYLCTHTCASYLLFVSMFLKTEPKLFETMLHLGSENVLEKCIVVGKPENTHGAVRGDTFGLIWAIGSTQQHYVAVCV